MTPEKTPPPKVSLPKKKKRKRSKLITGLVIGSAVGSVLGITLSDKDNRDYVKKKTLETWEKSRLLLGETLGKKRKKKTFWHKLNSFFSREEREE